VAIAQGWNMAARTAHLKHVEHVEHVVLVNEHDVPVGRAEKYAAHRAPGALHRAVSAWLVDHEGRVLLQRRAWSKYHFAGRWSNACCTHPRPGESTLHAVHRRLGEELGVQPELHPVGSFVYHATDPSSLLVEHEVDHVYAGVIEGWPTPDPAEVLEVQLIELAVLSEHLHDPLIASRYTPWLADVMAIAGGAEAT
jgi:isopentenyl-diphosphate Delta-isomerase